MSDTLHQTSVPATITDPNIAIAVLQERTMQMGRAIDQMRETQRREMEDLRASQKEMDRKLDLVLTSLHEARGGWRMICLLAGAAGTVGAAAVWLIQRLGGVA